MSDGNDQGGQPWDIDWDENDSGEKPGAGEPSPPGEEPPPAADEGTPLVLGEPEPTVPDDVAPEAPDWDTEDAGARKEPPPAADEGTPLVLGEPGALEEPVAYEFLTDALVLGEPPEEPKPKPELPQPEGGSSFPPGTGGMKTTGKRTPPPPRSARALVGTAVVALAAAGVPGFLAYNHERTQAQTARVEADKAGVEKSAAEKKLAQAEKSVEQLEEQVKGFPGRLEDLEKQLAAAKVSIQEIQGQLTAADETIKKLSERLMVVEDALKKAAETERQLAARVKELEDRPSSPAVDRWKKRDTELKEILAALRAAQNDEQVSNGLRRLVKLSVEYQSPKVLEQAASELVDRADTLIPACESAEEKDPKLRSRYKVLESLLHGASHDKVDATSQRVAPGAVRLISGSDRPRPIRAVAQRAVAPPGDPTKLLRQAIEAADMAVEHDSDEPYVYLNRGRLRVRLAKRLQTPKTVGESAQLYDEAAADFRQGLDRLKKSPETTDPEGHTARELAGGLSAVALGLKDEVTTVTAERDTLNDKLKTVTAERDKLNVALKTMTAERDKLKDALKTMTAERDKLKDELDKPRTGSNVANNSGRPTPTPQRDVAAAQRDELAVVNSELSSALAQLGETKSALDALRGKLAVVDSERTSARAQLGRTKSALDSAQAQLGQTKAELTALRGECAVVKSERTSARAQLGQTKAELAAARRERDSVRETNAVWERFAAQMARLVAFGQPLPAVAPKRVVWIDDLEREIESRVDVREVSSARAENALAAYASGLDFLNAGDTAHAIVKFSEAIAWDSGDARYYYYRGIARYVASGAGAGTPAPLDAVSDLRRGAALERRNRPEPREVGRALVRVQEGVRTWVESIRNPSRSSPAPSAGSVATR